MVIIVRTKFSSTIRSPPPLPNPPETKTFRPPNQPPNAECTVLAMRGVNCYNTYKSYKGASMRKTRSVVVSMRLPTESGNRLKRMANRHGWTPSDASARLVEEGLRRSEFAFIDFRDSAAGRQAYIQGSTLAIWEVMLLVQSYRGNVFSVARHLKWPEAKVQTAINYAKAFPEEIEGALSDNAATDLATLKRMLPQAVEFVSRAASKN